MSRPRPNEEAVRDQLREEAEEVAGEDAPVTESPAADGKAEGRKQRAEAEPEPAAEPEPEDELTAARRERDEYLDLARRTQADFENYRKRSAKEIQQAGSRARSGLASAPEGAENGLVEGVRLVHNELQGVLARAGVEAIEPHGEQFDPTVHEALSMRSEDGAESGVVLDVVEKGYRTADSVIRPARVVVAG